MANARLTPARAILFGTLVVGSLDLLDAIVFFGLRGAQPIQILHSIAAGLIGRSAAVQGGVATGALGFGLHFFNACIIVTVFYLVSRRLPWLTRHAVVSGIAYGVVAYFVMNKVVIPLSAIGTVGAPTWPVFANGILIHMFGVGLPTALFARAASRR